MSDLDKLLAQYLSGQTKKVNARSAVNGRFTTLLDRQINIGLGVRSRASRSQGNLRYLLCGENACDSGFPRIMEYEDSDFLRGSFDRHVKVWPLDDIDVFFPMNERGLRYSEAGVPRRFHVRTDESTLPNPIYSNNISRWTKPEGSISSSKLLSGFNSVLTRRYSHAGTQIQKSQLTVRRSIRSSRSTQIVRVKVWPRCGPMLLAL